MAIELTVNGEKRSVDVDAAKPLLWVLREDLKLTGTKYGCGIAQCGACTVLINGAATRACILPVSAVAGREVTTVEGMATPAATAVRAAWRELDVVQCGYCQSGQMLSATALLEEKPSPSDADINDAMRGNLCRCSTYVRVRAAIHLAAEKMEA